MRFRDDNLPYSTLKVLSAKTIVGQQHRASVLWRLLGRQIAAAFLVPLAAKLQSLIDRITGSKSGGSGGEARAPLPSQERLWNAAAPLPPPRKPDDPR